MVSLPTNVLVFLFQTVHALFAIAFIHSDGPNARPFASVYVHDPDSDPNKSYDDGVIYIRTRRAVPAAEIEDFSETDTDKDVKNKFLQAIGDKFDPEELTLFVKPHTFT